MLASFGAELLKIRKRPATWILALVWFILIVLFGYLFTYSFAANPPDRPEDQPPQVQQQEEAFNEQILNGLLPENLLENLFANGVFSLGAAIVLILGAMAAGSEYSWGTMKTSLTQRPGRLGMLSGKALALALFIVLFVLLGLAAGAMSSYTVALLEDASINWPPLEELAKAAGVGVLTFGAWGFLGFALGMLFRGTALAIGLGLAWALAVENTIALLPIESDWWESFRRLTLGENTSSVGSIFGSPNPSFSIPETLVEPERAAITLGLYVAVFAVVSLVLLLRRDVT
ncbi:MAG: ABC transporter permease [Actinomycetota bacterium]|jgi:ABC-type transport system involved in multi-copper enzyme maturation permease subunit|nr:ABC transporter permease [Rubrobacter sp.]MDQ3236981.1 ABC transporter permease [Actinomycetota bacterium]MDQ3566520.1 ABC transporter permease [Actinomycetota bacterium]